MIYIEKLEIQYFRSVYTATITNLNHLNILTGKNDVGKSNVLKALNLFFNNEVEDGVPFSFEDNFNNKRLEEVRKDSIKGKQYIQIKVTFHRGNRAERTLPERFTVVKKWLRNDRVPSVISDDLERQLGAAGKKLILEPEIKETKIRNQVVKKEPCAELHYHTIKSDSKVHFAKHVVPILARESFVHFKKLFELICGILEINIE